MLPCPGAVTRLQQRQRKVVVGLRRVRMAFAQQLPPCLQRHHVHLPRLLQIAGCKVNRTEVVRYGRRPLVVLAQLRVHDLQRPEEIGLRQIEIPVRLREKAQVVRHRRNIHLQGRLVLFETFHGGLPCTDDLFPFALTVVCGSEQRIKAPHLRDPVRPVVELIDRLLSILDRLIKLT